MADVTSPPPSAGRDSSSLAVTAGFKVDLSGVYVYVVDDNEDARQLLKEVLEYCGALVHLAASAEDALADLSQFLPTIVVADLALPGLDGLALVRALRKLPRKRGGLVPAIAITAHYEDFTRADAVRVGFNDFLQKPLSLQALCASISRLTRTAEIEVAEKLT